MTVHIQLLSQADVKQLSTFLQKIHNFYVKMNFSKLVSKT